MNVYSFKNLEVLVEEKDSWVLSQVPLTTIPEVGPVNVSNQDQDPTHFLPNSPVMVGPVAQANHPLDGHMIRTYESHVTAPLPFPAFHLATGP